MTTSAKATNSNNNNESSTTTTTTTNSNDNNIKLELWPTSSPGTEMQQPTTTTQSTPAQAPQLSVNSTSAPPQALSSSTNRVMQADEDFNIRFVNLVRLHRCLYDKKVPEYRNRDNQEKAWVLISQETRESVIHCKERWRNLRACLSRYIKQQSGSEPQHKPYYLTEHMAFLLPFLKSARSSLESNNSLTALYQLSQDHQQQQQHNPLQMLSTASQMQQLNNGVQQKLEFKQSLSENDDEETIDAFDPVISASLGLQRINATNSGAEVTTGAASPVLSDTASANTLQNFIPDVQLAESGPDLIYHPHTHAQSHQQHHGNHLHRRCDSRDYDACSSTAIKRIKTECEPTTSGQFYGIGGGGSSGSGGADGAEHADMEFFRSILPDLAALTPQQKRKFKIGILELIDEVVERYPSNSTNLDRSGSASSVIDNYGNGNGSMANGLSNGVARASGRQQRRNSTRDSAWRK